MEVTAFIQDTENMISSPALQTVQKYQRLLVVQGWLLWHWRNSCQSHRGKLPPQNRLWEIDTYAPSHCKVSEEEHFYYN